MQRRLFGGRCQLCHEIKPRLAAVRFRVQGTATRYEAKTQFVCEECRKAKRGTFRLYGDKE